MVPNNLLPVAIVGAGPYGLSIAAHLSQLGVPFRIFGQPMAAWRDQMPEGMFLKSEGFASNLSDPARGFTLARYCRDTGHDYRDFGLPLPRALFVAYGLEFQRKFAPHLEEVEVSDIRKLSHGFAFQVSGKTVQASQVVVAVGCDPFRHLPEPLAHLPQRYVSHSAAHREFSQFNRKSVCVIGGGASATDVAAALHAAGADVRLVARADRLHWVLPRTESPRHPRLAKLDLLGGGRFGQGYAYSQLAPFYRVLPARVRVHIARTYLGPRGGWPVRECVEALPKCLSARIVRVSQQRRTVTLDLHMDDGDDRSISADHIIAATGYRVELDRMHMLSSEIRAHVSTIYGAPKLSSRFESSVPGLYFCGYSAMHSFGPLMRFVAGADLAARRIAAALAKTAHEQVRDADGRAGRPAAYARPFQALAAPDNE
jgi:thioredoxin reductase